MATAVPVPIPPRFGEHEQAFQTSAVLWKATDFWRLVFTAALWVFTVCAVWLILKQVIK